MEYPNVGITQADLATATQEKGGMERLFQRQRDAAAGVGVNLTDKSLPSNYETKNGQIQVKPKSFMEKYGWMLAAAPMGVGAAMAFAPGMFGAGVAGSGASASMPAATTGLSGPIAGLPLYGAGAAPGAAAGASGMSGVGGFLKGLGKKAAGGLFDSISAGTGGAAQSMANNRGTMAEIMLDANTELERAMIARELEKRNAQSHAYNSQMTGQLAQNFRPAPRMDPRMGASYTTGSTPEQVLAGRALEQQGRERMAQPDIANPTGMPKYRNMMEDPEFLKALKPGIGEKILGWASGLAPFAGLFGEGE